MALYNFSCILAAGYVMVYVILYKIKYPGTFACNPPDLLTVDGKHFAFVMYIGKGIIREIDWKKNTLQSTLNKNAEPNRLVYKGLRFDYVGMTGFEPATTRPPGEYSTGLSYIPISAAVNIWLSTRSSVKMMVKASKFLILWLN